MVSIYRALLIAVACSFLSVATVFAADGDQNSLGQAPFPEPKSSSLGQAPFPESKSQAKSLVEAPAKVSEPPSVDAVINALQAPVPVQSTTPLPIPVQTAMPVPSTQRRVAAEPDVKNPTLKTAAQAFDQRRFNSSLKQFLTLDKTGHCSDLVHYYIARCYQQMAQVKPALEHYNIVMTRSRDPKLQLYSKLAAQGLSRYSERRTYEGNGNDFAHRQSGPMFRSSGGG